MGERNVLQRAMAASAMVMEMAILCIGGLLAGAWLDRRLGTSPGLLMLLTLLGFAGGLTRLLHALGPRHDPPPDDPP
jgi:F0F1-type ATP synthase assembly protein I